MENKKEKLKNKKKDIIANDFEKPEPKKEETKKSEPVIEEINTESQKPEEPKQNTSQTNSKTIAYINKIIYNIQLLLSIHNLIDDKLYNLLIGYLSKEHLKDILEERDCKEICGNMLCGKKLNRDRNRRFYYDSKSKDFIKEEIVDFFCDVRCMQKFKDALKVSQKFDYFMLARVEALCAFSLLPDFFPDNNYIENIAKFSKMILYEMKKEPEDLKIYEKKINDYFEIDEKESDKIIIS